MASSDTYLPCRWCGDPGVEVTTKLIQEAGDGTEEIVEEDEFYSCTHCLAMFTLHEMGWVW